MKSASIKCPTGQPHTFIRFLSSMSMPVVALMLTFSNASGEGIQGAFDVPWFTIDGGGGVSTGGRFVVSGTIGQSDERGLLGGDFELTGGFWGVAANSTFGDCNGDGAIVLADYGCFEACMLGPDDSHVPNCQLFDFDDDGDVDMADFSIFETQLTDPG